MKRATLLPFMALLVLFGLSAPVVAEESMEDMESRCRSYAVEDGISADELDDYVKDCIDGILQEGADFGSDAVSEPEENKE